MATPDAAPSVYVVGSANLDIVAGVPRLPRPGETLLGHDYHEFAGGKGLNQAIAAARSGAAVAFHGAIGSDPAGRRLIDTLHADHIDTTALSTVDTPTGRALICVDGHGENVIVVIAGANALVAPPTDLGRPTVVLTQLEVPLPTVRGTLESAKATGALTILNPAPAADLDDDVIRLCDIVVPNEHEIELLGGVDRLLERGVQTVIVTRGGDGVDVHGDGTHWHQRPFSVDVVDTTGAGDAFCGALAARLASDDDLTDAVEWASAAGALATTTAGAVPAQPTAAAIAALIDEHT